MAAVHSGVPRKSDSQAQLSVIEASSMLYVTPVLLLLGKATVLFQTTFKLQMIVLFTNGQSTFYLFVQQEMIQYESTICIMQ